MVWRVVTKRSLIGDSPVPDLSLLDELSHRPQLLLEANGFPELLLVKDPPAKGRNIPIWPVDLVQVHVAGLEAAEAPLNCSPDVVPVHPGWGCIRLAHRTPKLGCPSTSITWPCHLGSE